MSVDDFLNAQPIPPMGPETLGLGPAPMPPALPMPGQPQKRNPMDLAALALAAMLGPGRGTGILQGVQQAKQQQRQEQVYQERQQADLYRRQQEMYQWQQQQYEQDATRRQNALESNVKALQSNLPTLKTKAAYDQTIDTFAAGLQQMGLRVDGNYLRSRVPYVAPDGTKAAVDAIERWKKNPQNEKLLKDNPEQAAIAKIPVDRDGDGVPEMLTLDEAMTLAGMPFTREENGKIAWAPAGTTQADKANADGILADLLAKDKAEGKADTPQRRIQLRAEAMRLAGNASRDPKGPSTGPRDRYSVQQVTNKDGTTSLIRVNLEDGTGTPISMPGNVAGAGRPNEKNQASADFLGRSTAADSDALTFEARLGRFGNQLDVQLPNIMRSEQGQLYRNAQDEFINAGLRDESGAAIQPSEYDRYRSIYFVVPGDTPSAIKRKQEARARVVRGLRMKAGNLAGTTAAPAQPKDNSDIEAVLKGR